MGHVKHGHKPVVDWSFRLPHFYSEYACVLVLKFVDVLKFDLAVQITFLQYKLPSSQVKEKPLRELLAAL
jgi:hypothetical protein